MIELFFDKLLIIILIAAAGKILSSVAISLSFDREVKHIPWFENYNSRKSFITKAKRQLFLYVALRNILFGIVVGYFSISSTENKEIFLVRLSFRSLWL